MSPSVESCESFAPFLAKMLITNQNTNSVHALLSTQIHRLLSLLEVHGGGFGVKLLRNWFILLGDGLHTLLQGESLDFRGHGSPAFTSAGRQLLQRYKSLEEKIMGAGDQAFEEIFGDIISHEK